MQQNIDEKGDLLPLLIKKNEELHKKLLFADAKIAQLTAELERVRRQVVAQTTHSTADSVFDLLRGGVIR
jgi:hypothetical protein